MAFPNSLSLTTKTNNDLSHSSISLKPGVNGMFSFVSETKDSQFVGLGLSFDKSAELVQSKAEFSFFTTQVTTGAGAIAEKKGFLSFEDKTVLPILALSIGFEKAAETKLVVVCTDCKDDVVTIATEADIKSFGIDKGLATGAGIANWVKGAEPIPYGDKPSCDSSYLLFLESSWGANLYVIFYNELKNGSAFLSSGHTTGSNVFAAGTKEHDSISAYFFKAGTESFKTAESILATMSKEGCYQETEELK